MKAMVEELARYVRGWRGYFGFCETPSVLRQLGFVDQEACAMRLLETVEDWPQAVRGTGPQGRAP